MSMADRAKPKSRFGAGGTASSIISNSGSGMNGMIKAPKPGIDAFRSYKGGKSPSQNPEPTTKVR